MSTTVEKDLRTPWMAAADGGRVSRNVEKVVVNRKRGMWKQNFVWQRANVDRLVTVFFFFFNFHFFSHSKFPAYCQTVWSKIKIDRLEVALYMAWLINLMALI